MKLRIALLALIAVAGVIASVAVAQPPPGKGNPHDQAGSTTGTTATGTTGTTTTTKGNGHANGHSIAGKVLVCHRVGNGKYVLVQVSANSAPAKGKHGGDVLASNGTCPGPVQGHTAGTGEHTTTAKTTTAATTTS